MRKLSLGTGRTGAMCVVLLLQIAHGAALAQTIDAPAASPAVVPDASGDAAKANGPFGGCEPIGLTASGELVFPLDCKRAIKKAMESPVASEDKGLTAEDKSASAEPTASIIESKPSAMADTAVVDAKTDTAKPDTKVDAKPDVQADAGTDVKPAADPAVAASGNDKSAAAVMPAEAKPAVSDVMAAAKPVTPRAAKAETPAPDKSKKTARIAGKGPASGLVQGAVNGPANGPAKQGAAAQAALPPAARQVAMARPEQPAKKPVEDKKKQAEDKTAVRTAGGPECTHYRSYNAASKSYRGFDGRIYGCQ
jgi:hypothetical protein